MRWQLKCGHGGTDRRYPASGPARGRHVLIMITGKRPRAIKVVPLPRPLALGGSGASGLPASRRESDARAGRGGPGRARAGAAPQSESTAALRLEPASGPGPNVQWRPGRRQMSGAFSAGMIPLAPSGPAGSADPLHSAHRRRGLLSVALAAVTRSATERAPGTGIAALSLPAGAHKSEAGRGRGATGTESVTVTVPRVCQCVRVRA